MLQDQYLGRNDMWRLGRYLSGQYIYEDQEVTFTGGIAKIQNIYIDGEKVRSSIVRRVFFDKQVAGIFSMHDDFD